MRASDISVIIRDRNLVRTGVVTDGFLNLRVRFRFNAPSEWELRLPKTHPAVPVLSQPGSGIILALYGQEVLSGFIKRPDEIANFENPDGTFTFTGHDDTALLFHALAYPDPTTADVTAQGQSYDTRVGNPETVMRAFVAANVAGAHSSPPHPGRLGGFRDFIELEPVNGNRGGASITKSARFENLGEVLSDVATLGGLGFRIVQRGDFLRFEVYERRDVSDLVRFDIDSGTLKSKQVQKSAPGRTRVIVGGRGEGTEREFVQRTTAESLSAEDDWNLVIEEFVSYTNAESTEELQQTGDKRLIEDGFTAVAVKAIPADDQTMRFVHDWTLGDTVGLVMYGQPVKSFVTEAVLLANKDRVSVGAAVGDLRNFDPNRTNDFRVEDTQRRVSQLERTSEVPFLPSGFPPGFIASAAVATIPDGWLECAGQAVSRLTYPELFAAIGTQFGAGNGTTTFNLPNLRGRVVVGQNPSDSDFDSLGETGGAKTHTLTVAEMPSHTHRTGISPTNVLAGSAGSVTAQVNLLAAADRAPTLATGGGQAHNNLQPYIALRQLIKT